MLCCAQWKCSGEDGVFHILGAERGHFRGIGLKSEEQKHEKIFDEIFEEWKAKTRNEKLKIGSSCAFCCESSFQGRLVIAHI